jgi:hypothetical protein
MRNFLETVQVSDLVQSFYGGGQSSMKTEDLNEEKGRRRRREARKKEITEFSIKAVKGR